VPTEAIVRGHKSGLLTVPDYNNLTQCEALDDIKLNLVRGMLERQPRFGEQRPGPFPASSRPPRLQAHALPRSLQHPAPVRVGRPARLAPAPTPLRPPELHLTAPGPPPAPRPPPQTATDYGAYLANEASPLFTSTIVDRCTRKLVDDWNAMRCQADEKLARFLDFCTYGHMIDNVVLIVTGTLHERDVQVWGPRGGAVVMPGGRGQDQGGGLCPWAGVGPWGRAGVQTGGCAQSRRQNAKSWERDAV
jgi:hypothetical protein